MILNEIISNSWTSSPKKTCIIIFLSEVVAISSLLCIGFVYIHVYLDNYTAKRFPLLPVVCSSISDKLVDNCDLTDVNVDVNVDGHPESISFGRLGRSSGEAIPSNGSSKRSQWSSCGEFCSHEKQCRQVRVNVRSPGSEFRLRECKNIDVVECGFRISPLYEHDGDGDWNDGCTSNSTQQCPPLQGLYTCKRKTQQGTFPPEIDDESPPPLECVKITTSWTCSNPNPSSSTINCNNGLQTNSSSSQKIGNCLNKTGLHFCDSGACSLVTNLKEMCTNTNKCEDVPLQGKNVIITHENEGTIVTARCLKGFEATSGREIYPRGLRDLINPRLPPMLVLGCNHIRLPPPVIPPDGHDHPYQNGITLKDCLNGTLLDNVTLPPVISLKTLESIWHEALTHEDLLLDPIDQKYAPPLSNLSLFRSVRIYSSDFYKLNGCDIYNLNSKDTDNSCRDFYENYARLPGHFRGQSLFPCYCRNTIKGPPYCIIGDRDLFLRNWDDILVRDWLSPYRIWVLTFLSILLGLSLMVLLVLLCPVMTDSIDLSEPEVFAISNSRKTSRSSCQSGLDLLEVQKCYESRSRRPSIFLTPVTPFNNQA